MKFPRETTTGAANERSGAAAAARAEERLGVFYFSLLASFPFSIRFPFLFFSFFRFFKSNKYIKRANGNSYNFEGDFIGSILFGLWISINP